ncbi:MAG: hypothetical protein H6729_01280 [Deltaproteobacteria bacterium]|nr:hypothetical protein [Deltaproteobacteria bacterium]
MGTACSTPGEGARDGGAEFDAARIDGAMDGGPGLHDSGALDGRAEDGSDADGSIVDADANVHDGGGVDADTSEPARYFGFVPLAKDPATGVDSFTRQEIAEDANMVTLHFDFFGIPWAEFARGEPLPAAWVAEMDRVSNLAAELGLPVFLALTPLHGTRDKLAPNASGEAELVLDQDFGVSCEVISGRPDAAVITDGYAAYVRYMIDRFAPRFVALSIEVNLYEKNCRLRGAAAAWAPMENMLNAVYASEHARHPNLPIFNTFKLEDLWDASEASDACFGYMTSCLDENLARFSGLKNDVFALSTYPLVPFVNNGASLPEAWFSAVSSRVSVPLAIAETGYQASSIQVELASGDCYEALPAGTADQEAWVKRVIREASQREMPFVTWWSNRDLMPTAISGDCHCASTDPWCGFLNPLPSTLSLLYKFFGSMGLRDVGGTPRAAHAPWAAEVAKYR